MKLDSDGFVLTTTAKVNQQIAKAVHIALNPIVYFQPHELDAVPTGSVFVFDVESYENFFYVAFKCIRTGKVVAFEDSPCSVIDTNRLRWMLWRFGIIGFNSANYDLPIICCALKGMNASQLKEITNKIINNGLKSWQIEKEYNLKIPKVNHIDLIEVAPLMASLKTYAGRLHCKRMQDLPFDVDAILTESQAEYVRNYCGNDLDNTMLLANELHEQLTIRMQLSKEYNIDLRSKSDAQIAEAVIVAECAKINGYHSKKPSVVFGSSVKYKVPTYIEGAFQSSQLQHVLELVRNAEFVIDNTGSPKIPKELADLKIRIGGSTYKIGIGGLHSTEKCAAHVTDDATMLKDIDVESFYPKIIINQRLAPKHLGEAFLMVYEGIVNRRVEAKHAKNTIVSDMLKIVINGSFGKFGSMFSMLYSPELMLQVTISGQLSLLMLIERLESLGIAVVSANTDGIVIKAPKHMDDILKTTVHQWEVHCGFKMEYAEYKALYSRDINNYIAVTTEGKCKSKGAFSNPWADPKKAIFRFHKNPSTTIILEAVEEFITKGIPIEQTIVNCGDMRKFVSVRNVKGGAIYNGSPVYEEYSDGYDNQVRVVGVVDGQYLGKSVRWYYGKGSTAAFNYKTTGNKVPLTDGAVPCMELPDKVPADINHAWYVHEANEILHDIGYYSKPVTAQLQFF